MEKGLIACIPNFSEGRNPDAIIAISQAMASVPNAWVLHVDTGYSVNRTVITCIGPPDAVSEAAYQGYLAAGKHLDMRQHEGTHPRMGIVDVCPLVPLQGVDRESVRDLAEQLASRVGADGYIPVYLYAHNARRPERRKLSTIRAGEYEGWFHKIECPDWQPDYGPARVSPRWGVTAIGAREVMIAFNVNLDSNDLSLARQIAGEIRESGYRSTDGRQVPGQCPGVRAIAWLIPEFGCVQISMNLMDLEATSLATAFDTCRRLATAKGIRVTGSELVGMIPETEMLAAGAFFLSDASAHPDVLIASAVRGLGLDDKAPFRFEEKIIERRYRALAG